MFDTGKKDSYGASSLTSNSEWHTPDGTHHRTNVQENYNLYHHRNRRVRSSQISIQFRLIRSRRSEKGARGGERGSQEGMGCEGGGEKGRGLEFLLKTR